MVHNTSKLQVLLAEDDPEDNQIATAFNAHIYSSAKNEYSWLWWCFFPSMIFQLHLFVTLLTVQGVLLILLHNGSFNKISLQLLFQQISLETFNFMLLLMFVCRFFLLFHPLMMLLQYIRLLPHHPCSFWVCDSVMLLVTIPNFFFDNDYIYHSSLNIFLFITHIHCASSIATALPHLHYLNTLILYQLIIAKSYYCFCWSSLFHIAFQRNFQIEMPSNLSNTLINALVQPHA